MATFNGHNPSCSLSDRLKWELRPSYPLYSLEEPCNRTLDGAECFAPSRHFPLPIILRFLFLTWSLQVLYYDVVYTYPRHNLYIYLGYLTHIGHVFVIFYFTCSFLCSVVPRRFLATNNSPCALIKLTWTCYATIAPLQVAITTLYWGSGIATYPNTYCSIMEHGVLGVLVWIDGVWIGLVPVRAKQVWFLIVSATLYLLWTIIDAVLDIGNGECACV